MMFRVYFGNVLLIDYPSGSFHSNYIPVTKHKQFILYQIYFI